MSLGRTGLKTGSETWNENVRNKEDKCRQISLAEMDRARLPCHLKRQKRFEEYESGWNVLILYIIMLDQNRKK